MADAITIKGRKFRTVQDATEWLIEQVNKLTEQSINTMVGVYKIVANTSLLPQVVDQDTGAYLVGTNSPYILYLTVELSDGSFALASVGEFPLKGDKGEKGNDGTNGKDGKDGDNGMPVLTGISNPTKTPNQLLPAHAIYVNTVTSDVFEWDGSQWNFIVSWKGQKGIDGTNGIDGIDGTDGKDGVSLEYQSPVLTDPMQLPSFGSTSEQQAWIVKDEGLYYVYAHLADGVDWDIWEFVAQKGETGATGADGNDGTDGKSTIVLNTPTTEGLKVNDSVLWSGAQTAFGGLTVSPGYSYKVTSISPFTLVQIGAFNSLTTPISPTLGGTGKSAVVKDNVLVANSTSSFMNVPVGITEKPSETVSPVIPLSSDVDDMIQANNLQNCLKGELYITNSVNDLITVNDFIAGGSSFEQGVKSTEFRIIFDTNIDVITNVAGEIEVDVYDSSESSYETVTITFKDRDGQVLKDWKLPQKQLFWGTMLADSAGDILVINEQSDKYFENVSYPTATADGNVKTGTADVVIESWIASDGKTWYRKWKSGWKECGGKTSGRGSYTLTLPLTFSNTAYTSLISLELGGSTNVWGGIAPKTTNTCYIYKYYSEGSAGEIGNFYCCGL